MRVWTTALVIALLALVPAATFAQTSQSAPAADASCAWHERAPAEEQENARRLAQLQHELDARPVKGAALALGLSGLLTVAAIVTTALINDSRPEPLPALWAFPGVAAAGLIASGSALGVRLHQRKPFNAQRAPLLRQRAHLAWQRETVAREGCVEPSAAERAAAARIAGIDGRLALVKARAKEISLVEPSLLIALGAVGVGSALLSGLILGIGVADAKDHSEPVDRTPMRVAFGMIPVGAAVAVGGGVWFARRRKQRRAIMDTGRPLELEKRQLDMRLAPQVGPSSLGLTLTGRF